MSIQSLRNKFEEEQCYVYQNNCDLLLLVETWLDEEEKWIHGIDGYTSLHVCRDIKEGGVSIFLKKDIKVKVLGKSSSDEYLTWKSVQLGK